MIDYTEAKKRIVLAFCRGVLRKYGPRRVELEDREVEQSGPLYWDKAEQWTDPNGVARCGRFKRKPSRKVKTKVEIPKGVITAELIDYADAMAEAYLEVLRIAEEAFEARLETTTAEDFFAKLHRNQEAP
jgi:hypothetical protein